MSGLQSDSNGDLSELQVKYVEEAHAKLSRCLEAMGNVLVGQQTVNSNILTTLVAGGNANLIGLPGLGKSRLFENLGPVLGLDSQRIQFTSDLMPMDILGTEVEHIDENGEKGFKLIKGPVFTQLLMADEINRAAPRTQSALLQAMQEKKVTLNGREYFLKQGFNVVATQNPIEQEGTYPLPEAQMDRFLTQITISNTTAEDEKNFIRKVTSNSFADFEALVKREAAGEDILQRTQGDNAAVVEAILNDTDLIKYQLLARTMPMGDKLYNKLINLVRAARPDSDTAHEDVKQNVSWGPGPRAQIAFMQAARARALIDGRFAPNDSDLKALAKPVLAHRMSLSHAARARGVTLDNIIDGVVKRELKL